MLTSAEKGGKGGLAIAGVKAYMLIKLTRQEDGEWANVNIG